MTALCLTRPVSISWTHYIKHTILACANTMQCLSSNPGALIDIGRGQLGKVEVLRDLNHVATDAK